MPVYPERPPVTPRPETTAEPSRAQQRLLALVGPRRARTDEENEELSQVILTPAAWSMLRPTLYAPGRLSGGVLYGHRIDGVLHVQLVAPGGYPWWLSAPDPLDLDAHYTLGWSDCLRAQYADAIDWAGQWIMYPDRSLAAVATDHDWMLRGAPNRLIDHEHPLLVIGYIEGVLRVRAYRYEFGSLDIIRIPIESRSICGFSPTGGSRKKYVLWEMDVQAALSRLYGNWTECVSHRCESWRRGIRRSRSRRMSERFAG